MKRTLSLVLSVVMLLAAAALPHTAFAEGVITEEMATFGPTAFVCDGTPQCPNVTVKDGDAVLEENEHYFVRYRMDEIDALLMESAPSDAGDYVMIIEGCGGYTGTVEKRFSIAKDSPQFGKATVFGDHTFYVNEETGATSAVIKKDNDGNDRISWLREVSDGTAAWYGFDNTEGALPEGTIVSVKWYGKDTDKDLIQQKLGLVDDQQLVKEIKSDNVMMLELDATHNGNSIHEFGQNKTVTVHIEVNKNWDLEKTGALYVSEGADEKIPVMDGGILELNKDAHCITMKLVHCSTYMIYVKKEAAEEKPAEAPADTNGAAQESSAEGIPPKGTSLKKLTAGKNAFTVTWKKQTQQTAGYQIQYSTSRRFTKKTTKTRTVKKNKLTKATIKKCKANKKYYVRIRTYKVVGKTKYYSSWSKIKTVTPKK